MSGRKNSRAPATSASGLKHASRRGWRPTTKQPTLRCSTANVELAVSAGGGVGDGAGASVDTAGVVGPDQVMEVIGRRSVTIVDGAASETDAWDVTGQGPLMVSNVVLHSLPQGYRFDLERRERVAAPMLRALESDSVASS